MTASPQGDDPPFVTCPDCGAVYDLAKFRRLQLVDVLTLDGQPVRRLESRTCSRRLIYREIDPKLVMPESCRAELAIWIDRNGVPISDPWVE